MRLRNSADVLPKEKRKQGGKTLEQRAADLSNFKAAYLTNGHNATLAAVAIGHAPRTAHMRGHELVKKLRASGELAEMAARTAEKAELDTTMVLREIVAIIRNDPRRFFAGDGSHLMPDQWDDEMAACVASVEMGETVVGRGKNARRLPFVKNVKYWSKVETIDKAMRHLGLFERDNRQRAENLMVQVNLVGSPRADEPRAIEVEANLVRPNGNGSHA